MGSRLTGFRSLDELLHLAMSMHVSVVYVCCQYTSLDIQELMLQCLLNEITCVSFLDVFFLICSDAS